MARKSDDWTWHHRSPPPVIQDHSKAKLDLLGKYLREYLRIVGGTQKRYGHLELTVIDAFCGGGRFRPGNRGEADIKGSPLVLLESARLAKEELLKQTRNDPFDWNVRFVFNDAAPDHTAYLKEVLKDEGHDISRETITILTGKFEANLDQMIAATRTISPRAGRSLWILDQTGWTAATLASIARILRELPRSEVILTLARDNLLRLAVPNPTNHAALRSLGLSETVLRELADMTDGKRTGAVGQRRLMHDIVTQTRASEYSCFVLEPHGSRRAIVLVHLVNHQRARDAMIDMQWSLEGAFYHFAGEPAQILSYRGLRTGDDNIPVMDFRFNEHERKRINEELANHVLEEIHAVPGGKTVAEIMFAYRNRTPVTADDIRFILADTIAKGNIELWDENGTELQGSSAQIIHRLRRRDAPRCRVTSPRQLGLFSLF